MPPRTQAFALPVLQVIHEARREEALAAAAPQAAARRPPAATIRLNTDDRDALFEVDEVGTVCRAQSAYAWAGARATVGFTAGAYYFEATPQDAGIVRVGWATRSASTNLGTDTQGFGYGGTGKRSHAGAFEDYGEPYTRGDVIGCAAGRAGCVRLHEPSRCRAHAAAAC